MDLFFGLMYNSVFQFGWLKEGADTIGLSLRVFGMAALTSGFRSLLQRFCNKLAHGQTLQTS